MKKSKTLGDGDLMATVIWLPKNAKTIRFKAKLKNGKTAVMNFDKDKIKQARKDYLSLDPDDMMFATWSVNKEFLDKFAEETGNGDVLDPEALEYYSKLHE